MFGIVEKSFSSSLDLLLSFFDFQSVSLPFTVVFEHLFGLKTRTFLFLLSGLQ